MSNGCKTCRYAEWLRAQTGRVRGTVAGRCLWPYDCAVRAFLATLPGAYREKIERYAGVVEPASIWWSDPHNGCPAFEAKAAP